MRVRRFLLPGLLLLALASVRVTAAYVVFGPLALAWFLSRHDPPLRGRFRSPLVALAALFGLLVLCSALFSLDPVRSAKAVPGLSILLALPIAIDTLRRPAAARLLLAAVAVGGTAMAIVGLWQYARGAGALHDRIRGGTSHYMTFSAITMTAGCVLAAFAFEDRGRRRWAAALLSLVPFTAMVLTLTRSAYVGTLAAFLFYLGVRRPRGLLLAVPLAVLLVAGSPPDVRGRFLSIADLRDETNRDRIAMARAGSRMIAERPVFGLGPEMVKPYYTLYRDADAPRWRVPHLHNNVLQIAAANGVFAAAAYIAILALFFLRTVRGLRAAGRHDAAPLLAGPFLALTALTVAGLFEYNFGDTEVHLATLLLMAVPFSPAARAAAGEYAGAGG